MSYKKIWKCFETSFLIWPKYYSKIFYKSSSNQTYFEGCWICVADVACTFALYALVFSVSNLTWLKFGVIVGILDWRLRNENFQNWSLLPFHSHQMYRDRKFNRWLVLVLPTTFTKKNGPFSNSKILVSNPQIENRHDHSILQTCKKPDWNYISVNDNSVYCIQFTNSVSSASFAIHMYERWL